MSYKPEHREAVDSIRAYYGPKIIHAEVASREYAQLALRSIITLNAGVAVAYPAIAEVFIGNATLEHIIAPTALAVFGAVFGVICAYFVFFNHSAEADASFYQMQFEVAEADEHFERSTYWPNQERRQMTKEHWLEQKAKQEGRRNPLFRFASLFGVLSLFSFGGSVIWFATAALG